MNATSNGATAAIVPPMTSTKPKPVGSGGLKRQKERRAPGAAVIASAPGPASKCCRRSHPRI